MFETDQFRKQLRETINQASWNKGMRKPGDEEEIIELLISFAIQNERHLMLIESKKPIYSRKGISDALSSARALVDEAYKTKTEKLDTLTIEDIRRAYINKYCQIWPFCK